MDLTRLISLDRIECNPDIRSKKRVLERLSELLATASDQSSMAIFDKLIERERLGSTGLGQGIALPHGRLGRGENIIAAFIKLPEAISFDSADGQPVDLLFALLVPEEKNNEHLQTLAAIARYFQDKDNQQKIRATSSSEEILQQLTAGLLSPQVS
ncbi:MAG: PTS sugar transporter subunit IIA [Gammaproteobacteria bacterium]|nr:PTS sugar transporter subunit IIA [Gammaproteobacteria bacterium]